MLNIFASNLLARREEKRYTQAYMAVHCGMSQPNYSDIERGKTDPSISQLRKFAELLDTTVSELLSEDPFGDESMEGKARISLSALSEEDKDTYIRILEDRLRALLSAKRQTDHVHH